MTNKIHGVVTKIIGVGSEYRPDEHDRGEFRDESGVCLEYSDGYRDCFYLSEIFAEPTALTVEPTFRLAVQLGAFCEGYTNDPCASTRLAITRAAAEIGRFDGRNE